LAIGLGSPSIGGEFCLFYWVGWGCLIQQMAGFLGEKLGEKALGQLRHRQGAEGWVAKHWKNLKGLFWGSQHKP
jgi:hypothetical protein